MKPSFAAFPFPIIMPLEQPVKKDDEVQDRADHEKAWIKAQKVQATVNGGGLAARWA